MTVDHYTFLCDVMMMVMMTSPILRRHMRMYAYYDVLCS